jgi:hypothetical protein
MIEAYLSQKPKPMPNLQQEADKIAEAAISKVKTELSDEKQANPGVNRG